MDYKGIFPNIRRWKEEGALGDHRADIVSVIQTNRNARVCEKIGYALKNIAYTDWQTKGHQPLEHLKVAVLSNFTCDAYPHMLRTLLLSERIWPEIYMAGYNQYVYEFMMPDSGLYKFSPQVTLCLLDEHSITEELTLDWDVKELELICESKLEQFKQLVQLFHKRGKGLLVFNTIPLSSDLYNSKLDYKTKAQLSRIWRSFNIGLLALSDDSSHVVTLDTEIMLQEHQIGKLRDPRLMYHGSFYYSQELLFGFAAESVKVARSILGLSKKCLILDLDNTLWGGIIGDDGVDGVQLGDSPTGKIFVEFQKAIKQLKNQGVLLCISSKNEKSTVIKMFEQHPYMQLSLDDIVMLRANWNPKHENIKSIAEALNIGVDSLVFIDDNPFERSLVRESLPDVVVPELQQDPACYREDVLSAGWFNTTQLTITDRERTNQYRTEVKRVELKQLSNSIEDYLQSLNIAVTIQPMNDFFLPRLAQLTMRTNQFNMTTRRYQESELKELVAGGGHWIFGFHSRDCFGDYGMIGAVIVSLSSLSWCITDFMMSCRVFSRSIETAVLRHVLWKARDSGVKEVYAEFIPTMKNVIVKDFYTAHGFELVKSEEDKSELSDKILYVHRLIDIPKEIGWIQVMTREEVTLND